MQKWTEENVRKASKILSKHSAEELDLALEKISRKLGFQVTRSSLRHGFNAWNARFQDFLSKEADESASKDPTNASAEGYYADDEGGPHTESYRKEEEGRARPDAELSEKFAELAKITRKGPVTLIELCNKLNCSPKAAEELVARAQDAGIRVQVENGHIGRKVEEKPRVIPLNTPAPKEKRHKVAVISDTHLGSKYCLREELKEFIHRAYAEGVRDILHPGDVLDGDYRHGKFEMSHMGVEDQARDLFETLPQLPGLNYHCITGNHDWTFTEGSGMDVGHYIMAIFRKWGRHDVNFYGNRSAFLSIGGAKIHLWHPKKGAGYARSYGIQKQIENYASWEKPDILLTGHWHVFCYVQERDVHGFACPTFQGGGSAFSKSLGGAPAIGGLILDWSIESKHGDLKGLRVERVTYQERGSYTGLDKE